MRTEEKKKEMAHKMHGEKSKHHKGGMKHRMTTKDGGRHGEFYTQAGDRPHEGTSGERAKMAGKGDEKTKGEKGTQADTKGSFKETRAVHAKQR